MNFDVIIVGGGLVGGSLALRLADAGLSLALIDTAAPKIVAEDRQWDSRVYALAPGSIEYLKLCGAWQHVDERRTAAVEDMQIFGDDSQSELDFSAYDAGLRELAVIVESGQVQAALWRQISAHRGIKVFAPASCAGMSIDDGRAELRLGDGSVLQTRLIVGADGGNSWVRTEAGIVCDGRSYEQSAVVANFATEIPHRGIARQWFRQDGILALLPLAGQRVSMVWSTSADHAAELLRQSADELAAEVGNASANCNGAMSVITPPAAFPLRLQRVREMVRPRLALVGDAAHNVHPLAGQGVNLGFRDARELASVIAARGAQHDFGDFYLLRRYERARREDIAAMQLTTDVLQRLFRADSAFLRGARNFGLRLTNRAAPLKNLLVQQAVG